MSAPSLSPAPPATGGLTARQKAAVIVRLMLQEGAAFSLAALPEDVQADLTRELAAIRHIDRRTMEAVAEEFLADLESLGISFPAGLEEALTLLDGRISPGAAESLRQPSGAGGGDPWRRIASVESDRIVAALAAEAVPVAAVILAALPTQTAAAILGKMPGDRARRITYGLSRVDSVHPTVVRRIGLTLADQLESRPATAFEGPPVTRVSAILNATRSAMRDEVLDGLSDTDADFADEVRRTIFTFANIPERIASRDVGKIVQATAQADLIKVVAGAPEGDRAATDYLLANMSQRLAAQIREDAAQMTGLTGDAVEDAMGRIVEAIRDLASAGEITLTIG